MSTRRVHNFDSLEPEAVLFGARLNRKGWYRPKKYVYFRKDKKRFYVHDPKEPNDRPWTSENNEEQKHDWEVIGYET